MVGTFGLLWGGAESRKSSDSSLLEEARVLTWDFA
jgi:hypothetical protein